MTRLMFATALLFAACDDGIHDATPCAPTWPGPGGSQCEAACAEVPNPSGSSCSARFQGGNYTCPATFDYEGHEGCCVDRRQDPEDTVYFAECN